MKRSGHLEVVDMQCYILSNGKREDKSVREHFFVFHFDKLIFRFMYLQVQFTLVEDSKLYSAILRLVLYFQYL